MRVRIAEERLSGFMTVSENGIHAIRSPYSSSCIPMGDTSLYTKSKSYQTVCSSNEATNVFKRHLYGGINSIITLARGLKRAGQNTQEENNDGKT